MTWNKLGIYYYGASSYEHRSLMAPYLLQWKAMEHCKELGCLTYDLLGVAPPENAASSQLQAASSPHPWAGITDFKEKFGGELIEYPHEQQIVLRPFALKALTLKRQLLG